MEKGIQLRRSGGQGSFKSTSIAPVMVSDGPAIWLSDSAASQMELEGDHTFPLETGGVLLGYRAECGDLIIQEIIGPGPNAIHKRHSFTPDNHHHTQAISDAFYRSDGGLLYLGDWHTHPQGVPQLSSADERTIKRIAKSKESRLPTPVMILLAGGIGAWKCAAFQYESHSIWAGVTTALREVKRF